MPRSYSHACEHSTVYECSTIYGSTQEQERTDDLRPARESEIYKYGNRNFWCRGYYVDTVGKNEKMIKDYIKNQLEEDYTNDQISLKEFTDLFTGNKRK